MHACRRIKPEIGNRSIILITLHCTDSTDIVDCKLKLILGLIWTLILHYSISIPMMDEDDKLPEHVTPKERYAIIGTHTHTSRIDLSTVSCLFVLAV